MKFLNLDPWAQALIAAMAAVILFVLMVALVYLAAIAGEYAAQSVGAFLHDMRIEISRRLRHSKRFMAWLNDSPISAQIENEYHSSRIVLRNDWRG